MIEMNQKTLEHLVYQKQKIKVLGNIFFLLNTAFVKFAQQLDSMSVLPKQFEYCTKDQFPQINLMSF